MHPPVAADAVKQPLESLGVDSAQRIGAGPLRVRLGREESRLCLELVEELDASLVKWRKSDFGAHRERNTSGPGQPKCVPQRWSG